MPENAAMIGFNGVGAFLPPISGMARTTTGRNHYAALLVSMLAFVPLLGPAVALGPTPRATYPVDVLQLETRPTTTLMAAGTKTPSLAAALEPSLDWGNTRVRVNLGASNVGLNWLIRF
jgi:hypothetical protein